MPAEPPLAGRMILLVEPDCIDMMRLQFRLEGDGARVDVAPSAFAAERRLDALHDLALVNPSILQDDLDPLLSGLEARGVPVLPKGDLDRVATLLQGQPSGNRASDRAYA